MSSYRSTLTGKIVQLLPPLLLIFLTALVYYPSLHYEFQFDDYANIQKHFQIRSHSLWEQFFNGTRWISYWLNSIYYAIDKFNPFYYRLGNVIIHSLNGIFVFFILLIGLSGLKKEGFFKRYAFPISFMTALFFVLHPIQTQTVSYVIQGQLEGMAVMFILAMSLCFLLLARERRDVMRSSLIALLLVLAALSCGTKEIAIVSPVLLLLVDWFFVAQGDFKSLKARWFIHGWVFAIVGIAYFYLLDLEFFFKLFGFQMQAKNNFGNVITSNPGQMITPWLYCISQFKVILHYLSVFVWPFGMSVDYDWKLCPGFFSIDCLGPLMILSVLGFLLWWLWKKDTKSLVVFSALWFVVMILPRSSIIPSAELMYDYKTYGAALGVFFMMASALIWAGKWIYYYAVSWLYNGKKVLTIAGAHNVAHGKLASYGAVVAAALMAGALGLGSYNRNKVWRSGLEFWGDILEKAPKARVYNNYGVELSTKLKKFKESIPYFKKAIEMDDHYPDPCNNLAVAYANINKIDEAVEAVRKGLRINPYYPEGYNNLASFLLLKKDYSAAEKAAQAAIKLRAWYGKAHINLGRIYLELGKDEAALECFRNACMKADLDNEFGFSCYAQVAMQLQRYDEAIIAYQKVKVLNPAAPDIDFNMANAYVLAEWVDQGIMLYEKLLQSNNRDVRVLYNCAEAYLKIDKVNKALAYFCKAKPYKHLLPQLELRIAQCYSRLGQKEKSRSILDQIINDHESSAGVKKMAQNQLSSI